MSPSRDQVTRLLDDLGAGDPSAAERLVPLLYDELHGMARKQMRGERAGHTLRPTALVHEAYLRLVDQHAVRWESRTHFLAIAARMMRRVLKDHARARLTAKRGGGAEALTLLPERVAAGDERPLEVLALDEALDRLEALDARQARVVELRFYGGLSVEETALELGVSEPTVKRDWRHAKAWLRRELDLARSEEGEEA